MQCLDQNQTVKGKITIFWYKPNSTKIMLEVWMQMNYSSRTKMPLARGEWERMGNQVPSLFLKCADTPQYTRGGLKTACGAGALLPPLRGSQGSLSGCRVARLAWQAPSPRDHLAAQVSLAGNQYFTLRPSLPKTHFQFYKAMEEKDPLFKKSTLWSYWLNMEWLFFSKDSKILFSSNVDLTVYFDKWLRKINEALTINTNVYVHLYILSGCPMISYASDLN